MAGKKKTTKGRQKVEIKKISNQAHLYVTFSKRRDGAFKKANDLTTLCGTQIALLIPAPSGTTIHSFGTPDVETVAGKFLATDSENPDVMSQHNFEADKFLASNSKNLAMMLRQGFEADRAFRTEQLTQELALLETIKEGRSKVKENIEEEEEEDFFEEAPGEDVNHNQVKEKVSIMLEVTKKLEETVANRPSTSR